MAINYYEHHLGDYMRDTAHLSMLEDAAYRRLLDAYYIREKPLPLDPRECCKLARAASKAERDAVGYVLKEFFEERADGHHQTRADAEILRFQDKQAKAKRSAEVRWANRPTDSEGNANASADEMRTHSERYAPRARPQSPDTSHQSSVGKIEASAENLESAPDPDPDAMTVGQNPVVRACTLMREAGIPAIRMNPSHAELISGIREGATPEQYRDTAIEAIAAGKTNAFAWVLATVRNRNRQANDTPPARSNPAHRSKTREAIDNIDRTIAHVTNQNQSRLDAPRIGNGAEEAALPAPGRLPSG